MFNYRIYSILIILFIVFILQGCVRNPTEVFDQSANEIGLKKHLIATNSFDIPVYERDQNKINKLVHVYITGDGSPWFRRYYKTNDPTSKNSIVLTLMQTDTARVLLLGRPCYHLNGDSRNCHAMWWTSHRYSIEVIDAMVQALKQYLDQHRLSEVILIGYSGGGAIATLLAKRINPIALVTVSGNLETTSWIQKNQYTPLTGSINPADQLPLSPNIFQLHLLGGNDSVLDTQAIINAFNHQKNTQVQVYREFTHRCCWSTIWPEILHQLKP